MTTKLTYSYHGKEHLGLVANSFFVYLEGKTMHVNSSTTIKIEKPLYNFILSKAQPESKKKPLDYFPLELDKDEMYYRGFKIIPSG